MVPWWTTLFGLGLLLAVALVTLQESSRRRPDGDLQRIGSR